ncbi:hypothetical protein HNY73_014339 [Argiope bruennichi]|uniref:Uncharacterized protein n=1 Tax=Argiope bruennichi TaxID=94029 RepID=A0A8T0ENK9_ARGBR|nr:hypothetical protein HNY73_014339 [Argiope bruennichi]
MHPQKIPPQCRRKTIPASNLIKKKFIPARFEWLFRLPQPAHFFTLVTSRTLGFCFSPEKIVWHPNSLQLSQALCMWPVSQCISGRNSG